MTPVGIQVHLLWRTQASSSCPCHPAWSYTVSVCHTFRRVDFAKIIQSFVPFTFPHLAWDKTLVVPKTWNWEMMFLGKLWGSPQCLPLLFNLPPQGASVNIKALIKESISEGTWEWGAPSTFRWLQRWPRSDWVVGSGVLIKNDTRT